MIAPPVAQRAKQDRQQEFIERRSVAPRVLTQRFVFVAIERWLARRTSCLIAVSDAVLASRRSAMDAQGEAAWKPRQRERAVSASLRAYAAMATSADTGAVRDVSKLAGGN